MAEALVKDVHRVLIPMSVTCFSLIWPFNVSANTSQSFVKKKAALTLLRLYRKHPGVISAAEWALRFAPVMDDQDLARISHDSSRFPQEVERVPCIEAGWAKDAARLCLRPVNGHHRGGTQLSGLGALHSTI